MSGSGIGVVGKSTDYLGVQAFSGTQLCIVDSIFNTLRATFLDSAKLAIHPAKSDTLLPARSVRLVFSTNGR